MSQKVFVYGTLRKGGVANHLMGDSTWLGSAKLAGQLFKIDWYPGAVHQPETKSKAKTNDFVLGDLYEVSNQKLKELDDYEGCASDHPQPHEYRRIEVTVITEDGEMNCQFWEYTWDLSNHELIKNGDWLS